MREIMTNADKGRKIRDEKIIAMYEEAMAEENPPKLVAIYEHIANEMYLSQMTVYRVLRAHRKEVGEI